MQIPRLVHVSIYSHKSLKLSNIVFCFCLVPTVSKFDWNINLFPGSGDEVLLMATGFQSSIGENLPEWSLRKRKAPESDERLDDSQLIFVHQKSPIALHWLSGQLFFPPDNIIYLLLILFRVIIAEGIILWANDAELELLEYRPDEYIGQSIFKVPSVMSYIKNLAFKNTYHYYNVHYHYLSFVWKKRITWAKSSLASPRGKQSEMKVSSFIRNPAMRSSF